MVSDREAGPRSAVDALLDEFRVWSRQERGLAAKSVRSYSQQAAKFLASLPAPLQASLAALTPADVTDYVVAASTAAGSVWSAKAQVTALRALLRFLHVRGLIPSPLAPIVPAVAGWRLGTVPRGLSSEQVEALLRCHDITTRTGLRDKAVLTLLAVLGLRRAEAAGLDLADIDWRSGLITVTGKGSRTEQLPLPWQVGEALADYVMNGRPTGTGCTALFLMSRDPARSLNAGAVGSIMERACARAGVGRLGAHRLRHTLATDLLRAGASLTDIGQVLRHRSQLSTTIYAKVDWERLRELARPWPLVSSAECVL